MRFLIDESRFVGLSDDKLTSEVAVKLGLAIGTYFGKNKVIATARDFRSDSHMIKRAISSGLMATGVEILDLHAAPTASLQFIVRRFGCDGGISYTGAHYLDGEISVKILDSTGNELEKHQLEEIAEIAENSNFKRVATNKDIGGIESIENAMQVYRYALMSFINKSEIMKVNFRIVLDLSLGPISSSVPTLFSDLNIDLTTINGHRTSAINKKGALLPDPNSILTVSNAVKAVKANLGIILDVEGTKAIFIDERGEIIHPEDSTSFLIFQTLSERSGTIILSELFTKRYDNSILNIKGTRIVRVRDSPGNIGRNMESQRAVTGAADNGKLYNPLWGAESDGALSALTMITILSKTDKTISELMSDYLEIAEKDTNLYKNTKIVNIGKMDQLQFFRILRHKHNYRIRDTLIGIKLLFEEGVAHYYTSLEKNTINLRVECSIKEKIDGFLDKCIEIANSIVEKF